MSGTVAMGRWAVVVAAAGSLALGACAAVPGLEGPGPDVARGVPGFDTRDYPGDAAMRTWLDASPYRWVGFYLPAPCYTGTTWQGTRARLQGMGWGTAVLFVGEQDWAEILPEDDVVADPELPRCTRSNLHAERGGIDGAAAAAAAAGEGFATGTVIHLNVERVERVSSDLRDYVRAWAAAVLDDGRYLPGLYAHAHNAAEVHAAMAAEFDRAGRADEPRLWVATSAGFNLRRGPAESGFPAAHIWQGVFDTRETWGGVTLLIDANVARSGDPSR